MWQLICVACCLNVDAFELRLEGCGLAYRHRHQRSYFIYFNIGMFIPAVRYVGVERISMNQQYLYTCYVQASKNISEIDGTKSGQIPKLQGHPTGYIISNTMCSEMFIVLSVTSIVEYNS